MTTSVVARLPETANPRVGEKATEEQLERLFMEHHGFVWRVIASMGVARHVVDDLTQEVFLVAGAKLEDYDERGSPRAWLVAISRRVLSDHRKRESRRIVREQKADAPGGPADPEESLAQSDGARLIGEFLNRLPDPQREVFLLIEVEEMSAPQVASALREKVNTVYSRLRIARRRFDDFCCEIEAMEGPCEKN